MRVGHQRRVAAHQRDAGGVHRHVGAGAHGDADVGRGQRRRVVDAVADHRDAPRRRPCSAATTAALSSGSTSARTSSMPSCARHGLGAAAVVAGDAARSRMPSACSRATAARRGGLDACRRRPAGRAARGAPASRRASHDTVRPSACSASALRCQRAERRRPAPAAAACCRARSARPSDRRLPRRGPARRARSRRRHGTPLRLRARRSTARPADARCLPAARRPGAARRPRDRRAPAARPPATGLPSVSVPVLSKATTSTAVRHFQRLGVLDQDAVARRDAGAGHDGRRRGQPQRAGAGDHQHRDGVEDRRSQSPVAEAPAQQREQRDAEHHRHEDRADAVDQALDRRLRWPAPTRPCG